MTAGGSIGLALSGDRNKVNVHGDILLESGQARAPRSGYMLEVQELSAQRFEGREAELAAMAAFSSAPEADTSGYWRWLAPAWAGKTALMAHFALHPPPDTDVLAFFVTARMADRADRTAFLSALESQLGEYLDDGDVRCSNQGAFLESLQRAADRAQGVDRQLLLVVDGLDEDAGLATASTGYSIAALLPRTPPPGLRLIVAGRTHPPLPGDVPPGHPLRDPATNHELLPAPAAWVVKEDAERNLDALIAAGGLTEELVGLTAAGGGLTAPDLAELTGQTQRRIELVLGGSIGRAFQIRPTRYAADGDGAPLAVYSFAHQELFLGARELLRPSVMQQYRDRLHSWVESAREAGWPATTPEWVLIGYPRTLVELQDADRLFALATDSVRHERMWQFTGADIDALAEITNAFTVHGTRARPDISVCVRLAHQRENLVEKTRNVPDGLIYAWARMGHLQRAVALAVHSADSIRRLDYSSYIVQAVGSTPESLAAAAEIIRTLDPIDKPFALVCLGEALVEVGDLERASDIASQARHWALDIPNASRRDEAAMASANLLARVGREEESAELARSLVDEGRWGEALGSVAEELARAGKHSKAINFAREAILLADTSSESEQAVYALCLSSRALALAGLCDEAADIARQVVDLAADLDSDETAWLCRGASMALAQAGYASEGADLIRALDSDWDGVHAFGDGAEELARNGKMQEAAYFAREAERIVSAIGNATPQEPLMAVVARALAVSGNVHRAYEIGLSLTSSSVIIAIAHALADYSHADEAGKLAQYAVDASAAISDKYRQGETLGEVSALLARCGRLNESAELAQYVADTARTKTNPNSHAVSLLEASAALFSCGQIGEAIGLAERAVAVSDTIEDLLGRCEVLARSALLLCRIGKAGEATGAAQKVAHLTASLHRNMGLPYLLIAFEVLIETEGFEEMLDVIKTSIEPPQRAEVEFELSIRLLERGRFEEAVKLARDAAGGTPHNSLPFAARKAHRRIVNALAEAELMDEAMALLEETCENNEHAELISLAKHLVSIERADDAVSFVSIAVSRAREVSRSFGVIGATYSEERTLVEAAGILATVGRYEEAVDCALAVSSPRCRIDGLLAVVEAGAGPDELKQSVKLVKASVALALEIDNDYVKSRSLRSIVGAKARCGLVEEALILAGEIADDCQRSRGVSEVALVLAKEGQRGRADLLSRQAIDFASRSHDPVRRGKAIRDACQVLALTAVPREVIDTALSIEAHDQRCEALVGVAKSFARSIKAEDAIDAVLCIPDEDEQVSTFREVARLLISQGGGEELLRGVRKCSDPFWLETALPLVVESRRGWPDGIVLLAEALAVKSPTSLISLIASFDGQAVKTYARCLMS
uniref:Tetratricopeptide repeat protein n=1 Tax=Streptomyces pratensis (strain ATCC 33331 / IAF-45CD) TaxID=591167 RepID=A0A8D3WI47_STRFA